MKNQIKSMLFSVLAIMMVSSCGGGKQEQSVEINTPNGVKEEKKQTSDIADVSFIDGMTGKVFHNYLQVKMALVNTDLSAAKKASGNMAEAFSEERVGLKQLAEQMEAADDIETQRELFSEFTLKVEPLIKNALSGGTIYKQHCPMAFDKKGAYWLADIREIRNPYLGDKMLNCGSINETITKK